MRKRIRTFIWLGVALLTLGLWACLTPWVDFRQAIGKIGWSWTLWGILVYLIAQTLLASRWVLLLRVHGVYISQYQAIKLTYLGLFYNNMMPGAVGGDLLKGWFITQHGPREQRVEAAVTVFVDRLVGLIGMIWVAALASLFIGSKIAYQGFQIRWLVWFIFIGMAAGAVVFLSRRVRRMLLLNKILEMLPFARLLRQIDQAIRIYRRHIPTMLWALVLTAIIQGMAIVALWMQSQSLHLEKVTFLQCLTIMPIVWLIGAAIPAPGGLGIIEGSITYLFCVVINPDDPASATGSAAALALLNRLMICACSLPGALVPIFGGHLPKAKEMQEALEKDNLETDQFE